MNCRCIPIKLFFSILLLFTSSTLIYAQNPERFLFKDVSKDRTFDVVTWNIEWFGSEEYGPENVDLQLNNVIEVIKTMDADLYAFQEIANKIQFEALDDSLENYRGFTSNYSQSQQTAFLFKSSVIDSVDSGYLLAQQNEYDWAGRLPLYFETDISIAGQTLRSFFYNIHAKAFADRQSYNRRRNAANSLKNYLDRFRQNASTIILGDFNDMLTSSTFEDNSSPYEEFIEDDFYLAITKPLEEDGQATYLSEEFRSFIDHMIVTNVLKSIHMNGAQMVANVDYIENFETTTSDHAPVWTRFDFTMDFVDTYEELPEAFTAGPNYPNPFNPTTTIPFALDEPTNVTITVYDIMGREVSIPLEHEAFEAGEHSIIFSAQNLTSGIYLYRIELGTGEGETNKMTFIN